MTDRTNKTHTTNMTEATTAGRVGRVSLVSPVSPVSPQVSKIVLPHGGYRNLIVYDKSEVIYQATVLFCRRFLPKRGDRTVDQMTQAARSCKQNIAEGSSASGTSKETEIKLTNVARATLSELEEDYLDYLKSHGLALWRANDKRKVAARNFSRTRNKWDEWKEIFETRSAETFCNLMVMIVNQTKYLLSKMIIAQEEDFKRNGGVRERMHAARTAARGQDWDKAIYSRLDAATSPDDLAARLDEIKCHADRAAWSIRKRKGWA